MKPDISLQRAITPNGLPPILIVPGAFISASAWQNNFANAFCEAGFDVYSMNFTARSLPRKEQALVSLDRYKDDLIEVIQTIGEKPILMSYSLGGLVAYQYLESNTCPAALFLSAVPPEGFLKSYVSLLRSSPISAAKLIGIGLLPGIQKYGSAPKGIYSREVDQELGKAFSRTLGGESVKALVQASFRLESAKPIDGVPCKLYGSTGDLIVSHQQVIDMAIQMRAEYKIFDTMAHSVMVEPRWPEVSADMINWVFRQFDSSQSRKKLAV